MGVGAGLSMYVVVVQKFTFAILSPDEFLLGHRLGDVLTEVGCVRPSVRTKSFFSDLDLIWYAGRPRLDMSTRMTSTRSKSRSRSRSS